MPLQRVINATGVILHTGAGRAPYGAKVVARAAALLEGYVNLEVDLATGERGRRDALVAEPLRGIAAAEDALVVNNNAAAVLLALRALAGGKPAAASRGQLVEVGGSFRLLEVMAAGGVSLLPVGTVNVTRVQDYRRALEGGAALVVLAHRSNFYFRGRWAEPLVDDVVALAAEFGRPVLYDLGSGLLSPSLYPDLIPEDEPSVAGLVAAGVDAVCCSGDKVLGGPQAGIIVGKAVAVAACRADPLYRALRVGKETYALLTAVLEAYSEGGDRLNDIPAYRLLSRSREKVTALAAEVAAIWRKAGATGLKVSLADDESLVGGGSLPYLKLPTTAVALRHERLSPHAVAAALRRLAPPVLARAAGDAVYIDVRSVLEEDIPHLARAGAGADEVFKGAARRNFP